MLALFHGDEHAELVQGHAAAWSSSPSRCTVYPGQDRGKKLTLAPELECLAAETNSAPGHASLPVPGRRSWTRADQDRDLRGRARTRRIPIVMILKTDFTDCTSLDCSLILDIEEWSHSLTLEVLKPFKSRFSHLRGHAFRADLNGQKPPFRSEEVDQDSAHTAAAGGPTASGPWQTQRGRSA